MSTKTINFEGTIQTEQLGDVLRTSGVLMKVGQWVPSDGEETTFTKESILKIFDSLKNNNPLWITHDEAGIQCRAPIGFAYRFGLNDTKEEIHWEGLVFDPDAINSILLEGYDSTSMEADLTLDDNGIVLDGIINGNAFVTNPAVEDETIKAEFVKLDSTTQYSDGSPSNSTDDVKLQTTHMEGKNMPTNLEDLVAGLSDSDKVELGKILGTQPAEPTVPVNDGKDEKITELEAQFAAVTEENSGLVKQFEEIKTKEFEAICSKLVEFGIAEPQKIAEGINMGQRVEILKQFQESLVKDAPPVTTGDVKDAKKSDAQFEEMVKETGLGDLVDKFLK